MSLSFPNHMKFFLAARLGERLEYRCRDSRGDIRLLRAGSICRKADP